MPLRTPTFLDMQTLEALAEYHEIQIPVAENVVARTVNKGSGKGQAGLGGVSVGGSKESEVEFQSSYSLTPNGKATVSKIIDRLIKDECAVVVEKETIITKDLLVELDGKTRMTGASLAGKMFYMLLRSLKGTEQTLDDIDIEALTPGLKDQFKAVYLSNELLPIPVLLELSNTGLQAKVYVSLDPHHFVEAAAADRTEGECRVLGTVSAMVDEGDYLGAEPWLLTGWEFILRRVLMANADDVVAQLVESLDLALDTADVQAIIKGPAVVINAVAIY